MKICLVGPGIMSIPPPGWGAVEILIWDYYQELKKLGHEVVIVNKMRKRSGDSSNPNCSYIREMIKEINQGNYDFVHLHYDCHYYIMDKLTCPKVGITSHYPYIDQINRHRSDGFGRIFKFLVENKKYYNFVLADKDIHTFMKSGADKSRIFKLKNGVKSGDFKFSENPSKGERSIYLGKITERKKQHLYQYIESLDFVGPCDFGGFNKNKNYLGSWSREEVKSKLTEYGNLVLLSAGEADPLVVKEGLCSGLGIVVSEKSAENLDSKEFITVIPDNKLADLKYIEGKIIENRKKSLEMRKEIRDYGISKFDISVECKNYINNII